MGFPVGSDGKESACNTGDLCSAPGLGRSPRGEHCSPLQYTCLENPHGQRSLAGYSPWGCKELDMTEVTKHNTTSVISQNPVSKCSHIGGLGLQHTNCGQGVGITEFSS